MPSKAAVALPLVLLLALSIISCQTHDVQTRDLRSAKTGGKMPSKQVLKKAGEYGLVEIRSVDPTIAVELRYATSNNVTGRPMYPANMPCLVYRSTAQRLAQAQKELRKHGLSLKIWDAYRPPHAHITLWNSVGDARFVVPAHQSYSWHCTGTAVDVTLVDLQGRELEMPTDFDEFTDEAATHYKGTDAEVRQRVYHLHKAMRDAGFEPIVSEWWHFKDSRVNGKIVFASHIGLELPEHVRNAKARP